MNKSKLSPLAHRIRESLSEDSSPRGKLTDLLLIPKVGSQKIPDELLDRLYTETLDGVIIKPKSSQAPLAWDSEIQVVQGNYLQIFGSMSPGGSQDGTVTVLVKLSAVSKYYDILIRENNDGSTLDSIQLAFQNLSWDTKWV